MLKIVKDTYHMYFKKMHIWFLFILPMILYSFLDEFLLKNSSESFAFYATLSLFLSPLVFAIVEMSIYRYVLKVEFGKVLEFVKKLILFTLVQVIFGFVAMIPVFILGAIAAHHNIVTGWLVLALIANIFLGGWLLAKVSVVLPLIITGEKFEMNKFWMYCKAPYRSWLIVSALVYFPYIATFYLIDCNFWNIIVSGFLSVIITLFNSAYYQANAIYKQ